MIYATYHDLLMYGFYVLACLLIFVLVLLALAWCWDRWCRRAAKEQDDRPEQFPPTHPHFTRHRHHF